MNKVNKKKTKKTIKKEKKIKPKYSNFVHYDKTFSIKMTIYLSLFSLIKAKLEPNNDADFILNNLESTTTEHILVETLLSIKISINEKENNANKAKQKKRNKTAHITNGNKQQTKNKN